MTRDAAAEERFNRVVTALTDAARADVDMADFLAQAASAAAANVGGIDQLLVRRSGSWEADLIQQLVAGTVGWDGEHLHEHRTEPITVRVDVEDILADLGIEQLYEQAHDELERRDNAVWARNTELIVEFNVDDDAELTAVDQLRERLKALHNADWAAYGQAFADHVRQAADELFPGLTVPVKVVVTTDWQPGFDSGDRDGPEWRLWEAARQRTPLPGSGSPLADYAIGADIAAAERGAGRDPLTRLTNPHADPKATTRTNPPQTSAVSGAASAGTAERPND